VLATPPSSNPLIHGRLAELDPTLAGLLEDEDRRQLRSLSLIASENYVPQAVLDATGSVMVNKYSEGYPGRRYYEGQEVVDRVEILAAARARALFGAEHANVQPYSGSPANLAVYLAMLDPGDTVMGMALPMGGHLTHGWKVSITGKWFRAVQYGVDLQTGMVDLEEVRELAVRERPRLIFCGGTAVPRTIDFAGYAQVAAEVDATLVADVAHIAGLIAGGAHPSPFPHADIVSTTTHKTLRGPRGAILMCREELASKIDRAVFPGLQGGPHNQTTAGIAVALELAGQPEFKEYAHTVVANAKSLADALLERGYQLVSGGTDNHLILVDLRNFDIGGKTVAGALDRAGITTNYNTVPGDPRPPLDPSGLRLGTAAITTRGLVPDDMPQLAGWIDRVLRAVKDGRTADLDAVTEEVAQLASTLPVPGAEAGPDDIA
jgi:glycine hydroxymethyltransferase